ncbi:hypothetical protein UFOVP58_121 [uncultured Caudovirales phage]|uniref:Prohead core protein n=1 Tax=uncultured Caudovirales phage TaxID=2100421 RepID=A0A6J5KVX3_9CAUD|nr:hypothetical protein UFOVP58_121 [uncultured Caudovirales phage]
MSTKDLINAIASGDAQQIETTFETVMTEKISVALDAMRSSVAQNMFKEEVELEEEQLDELSKKTLDTYVKKARNSRDVNADIEDMKGISLKQKDDARAKIDKRQGGIYNAKKRLAKEEVEFTLEDYSVAELEDFMLSEDFEQLDELSKGTLGSYVKKAKTAIVGNAHVMGMNGTSEKTKAKAEKTVEKRAKGINKAVDKLTEDEEVVEEGYDSSGAYEKHDPKHPAFMKNYTKFKAANPKGNIGDFVAHMKKQK